MGIRASERVYIQVSLTAANMDTTQDTLGTGFEACKSRVYSILNDGMVWNGITKDNIAKYIYTGPVQGMKEEYQQNFRNQFVTLNLEGKSRTAY